MGMELARSIGQNLKDARKAKGLTQKEIAAELLMTQQQYSRFENGVYELNYEQNQKTCRIVETTPDLCFEKEF